MGGLHIDPFVDSLLPGTTMKQGKCLAQQVKNPYIRPQSVVLRS